MASIFTTLFRRNQLALRSRRYASHQASIGLDCSFGLTTNFYLYDHLLLRGLRPSYCSDMSSILSKTYRSSFPVEPFFSPGRGSTVCQARTNLFLPAKPENRPRLHHPEAYCQRHARNSPGRPVHNQRYVTTRILFLVAYQT